MTSNIIYVLMIPQFYLYNITPHRFRLVYPTICSVFSVRYEVMGIKGVWTEYFLKVPRNVTKNVFMRDNMKTNLTGKEAKQSVF